MNDVSRTSELELPPLQLREPWWRQTGQRIRRSQVTSMLLVLLGLALLGALGWYLAHRNATGQMGRAARFRLAATAVGFATASHQDVPIYLDALGEVVPLATAVVQAQVSGVMTKIYYHEGQMVKAGDPLVQIDPRPFKLALEQAQGSLNRDAANLANQSVIVKRDQILVKQDSLAQQQLDTDSATQKQLEAMVATDKSALDSAQLNLNWTTVAAPISGRVGIRPEDPGNYVTPSLTNGVANIVQLTPIDVMYALPADAIAELQERLKAGAQLPTTVLDRTRTHVLGHGAFLALDDEVDASTGTVRAKSRFSNDDGALFPQEFVNVRLLVDTLKDAIVVPSAAVRHGPNGDYVYVIAPDSTVHIQLVKTGPADGDDVSIASGLAGGERVVTEGGDRLVDGATVRLPGQTRSAYPYRGFGQDRKGAKGGRHRRSSDDPSDARPPSG
ncbi:MAG TPA: efflux RND transporter periplasmic adaptor subunit [Steroidobacteraceae bacterium]|nr:efflux RND transporter periplasmic adaptor subunit [Steroidobacteraceae bacterium]